jgi:hypothetical protein
MCQNRAPIGVTLIYNFLSFLRFSKFKRKKEKEKRKKKKEKRKKEKGKRKKEKRKKEKEKLDERTDTGAEEVAE